MKVMVRIVNSQRFFIVAVIFALSAAATFGQDLGSSNNLFRASNPKTKSNKKETPAKPKPEPEKNPAVKTAKKNTPPKKEPKKSVARKNQNKTTPKETAQKPVKQPVKQTETVAKQTPQENVVNEEIYERAIEDGNAARDNRNYTQAEVAYRRAVVIKPKDSRAIYGMGNLYSDQQRWEEAEKAYRQAIALEPENPDPYAALSFVLTQPIVGMDLSVRFSEAEQMARKAIQLDNKNPVAFDQLGVALELSGKIGQETANAYKRAIELDPKFALAYAHLGRLLRRNGKINESGEAYRKAMQFANDVPTMILVADVLQSQQRYTDSEQLLRLALKDDPKNPTALYLLGRALTTRAAFDEAEQVLKKSVEVSPDSFVSYALLGSLYSRRGDFTQAEKVLNRALQVISENEKRRLAQEFEMVGDGLMRAGKKKDAFRVYQQAAALDGEKAILAEKLSKAQQD